MSYTNAIFVKRGGGEVLGISELVTRFFSKPVIPALSGNQILNQVEDDGRRS